MKYKQTFWENTCWKFQCFSMMTLPFNCSHIHFPNIPAYSTHSLTRKKKCNHNFCLNQRVLWPMLQQVCFVSLALTWCSVFYTKSCIAASSLLPTATVSSLCIITLYLRTSLESDIQATGPLKLIPMYILHRLPLMLLAVAIHYLSERHTRASNFHWPRPF